MVLVSYYKASSTMGGHQDNIEVTFDHPVASLSLGSQSVFLKGRRVAGFVAGYDGACSRPKTT